MYVLNLMKVCLSIELMRQQKWHPTVDEWTFFLFVSKFAYFLSQIHDALAYREGTGRVTVFAAQSNAETFNYQVRVLCSLLFDDKILIADIGWRHRFEISSFVAQLLTNVRSKYQVTSPPEWVSRHQNLRYSKVTPGLMNTAIDVGHYVENIGNTTLTYLEIFNGGQI